MNKMKKKILDLLAKIKVQRQLYLIFFTAIFIPVACIGGWLIYNSRSLLLEQNESQTYADNLRVKSLLLDLTESTYTKAQSLAEDRELISLLSKTYPSYSEGLKASESYGGFTSLLSQDASIQNISVYTWNESLSDSNYIHPITQEIQKEDWFLRASSSVTPFWSNTEISDRFGNPVETLCLHMRIFLPHAGSYAVLNVSVSNNHLKNRIQNRALGTILWTNGNDVFYSDKPSANASILNVFTGSSGNYLGKVSLDDQEVIACICALSTSYSEDVFYIASLNYDGYPYIKKITGIHLGILFLILLAACIYIYLYSKYLGSRVVSLRESMHNASQGNYEISDSFEGEDEISEAFRDLNVMIQDILTKEASVYKAQIREQELINQQQQMEFRMLSSQINPHFLYNTLETIRMRSLKAGNRDVANAVKLLGKSMRYVLQNTTTSFTSLENELDYIETYLAIQRLRFHDKVNYSLRIPPDMNVADYQIMPLLLQPIVENAILHGLEETEENGRIILHLTKKQENLYIDIFDNGCGMTPAEIRKMKNNIYHHPEDSSKSIGLYNIYERIRLCYGDEYGLCIRSKKDFGTLITVIIPAQKYRKETDENETIYR